MARHPDQGERTLSSQALLPFSALGHTLKFRMRLLLHHRHASSAPCKKELHACNGKAPCSSHMYSWS